MMAQIEHTPQIHAPSANKANENENGSKGIQIINPHGVPYLDYHRDAAVIRAFWYNPTTQ